MGFTFGDNWEEYIAKNYSEERVEKAKVKLLNSLKIDTLKGRSFLDIGLGSGIHSLAAYKAGADKIVSFDIDKECIKVGKTLATKVGNPKNWQILEGSVLDVEFVKSLGKFDIVYSWGVLHHTGNTLLAVENAVNAMKCDSVFFVALYSYYAYLIGALWRRKKFGGGVFPEEWMSIKEQYHNRSSFFLKKWLEIKYIYSYCLIPPRYSFRSWYDLYKRIVNYKEKRGMAFMSDVKDWLGGWPMDFVKEDEFDRYCHDKLGLEPICMNTGEGVTEFFFKKEGGNNYLDTIINSSETFSLLGVLNHYKENTFSADLRPCLKAVDFDSFDMAEHSIRMYREGVELYAFTGGIDGVLSSTVECYNIIDGILYYTHREDQNLDSNELYLKYLSI